MALMSDGGHRRRFFCYKRSRWRFSRLVNKWSQLIDKAPGGKRSPLGQKLLVADQGISALFTGLGAVLIAQGLQMGLHGVEDRVVLVQRFRATPES